MMVANLRVFDWSLVLFPFKLVLVVLQDGGPKIDVLSHL